MFGNLFSTNLDRFDRFLLDFQQLKLKIFLAASCLLFDEFSLSLWLIKLSDALVKLRGISAIVWASSSEW